MGRDICASAAPARPSASPEGEAACQETPDPFIKLVGHVAHETRVNRPEIVVDLGDPTDPPEEVRGLEGKLVMLQ